VLSHSCNRRYAGVVCDKGLTLGDLIGILHLFFSRLGLKKLRFKPAFNPYTEPSMEIFSYSEQLQKWVEVSMIQQQSAICSACFDEQGLS